MSLVSIHNLNFTYPGRYDPVFAHADAQLDTRWKLGLTGRNGRGKTTLLHLLDGSLDAGGAIAGAPGGGLWSVSIGKNSPPPWGLPFSLFGVLSPEGKNINLRVCGYKRF